MIIQKKKAPKHNQSSQKGKERSRKGHKSPADQLNVNGSKLGTADILALQRLAGNRHVERLLQRQEEDEKSDPVQSERTNPFETIHALISYLLQAQVEEAADEYGVDPHLVGAIFAQESAELGAFEGLEALETPIRIPNIIEGNDLIISAWEWLTRDGIGSTAFAEVDADLLEERIATGQIIPAADLALSTVDTELHMLFGSEGISPEQIATTLRTIQDQWALAGVDLAGQHAVLASLYGAGSDSAPDLNRVPRPTSYGMEVIKQMLHIESLYGANE